MNKVLNVGIAGFGTSAKVFNCPFINANPNFKIKKVFERHGDMASKIYPYTETVSNIDDLLADEEIELIIVTTPTDTHYNIARKALLANKNVVVEKPFTINSEEAQELIELSEKQHKVLSVYQSRRLDGDFLTVKSIIKSGCLGRIVEYEAHFDRFINTVDKTKWRENDSAGSGVLYDLGSHLIDQTLCLFGLPLEVTGDIRIQRDGGKADDNFQIILSYTTLKVTLKSGMLVREPAPHFTIYGTNGSFVKYGMDPQTDMLKMGTSPLVLNWGKDAAENWGTLNTEMNGLHFIGKIETLSGCYEKYYKNIYNAIVNGENLIVKPEEAKNTIQIIELAIKSSKEKRTVKSIF